MKAPGAQPDDSERQLEGEELAFAGLSVQVDLLARREISCTELVELSLARIAAAQPTLNAFRCVRSEAALAEARQVDRRLARGERAPLLGVPVAIKDDIDLAGETTSFGARGEFEPVHEDCEAVRRLRAAGAVIVGKTNTPEFGQWPITESEAFGVTRNPWSSAHTPGGSSGGAAAAVAAGLVPAALGSDGLGSVRIPAAWTNLVGIKPQRGRISTWPEPAAFNGLACIGPLARTTSDAALLLDATAGNHPGDAYRPPAHGSTFAQAAERDPGRLRIALSFKPPFSVAPTALDPVVRARVERLAGVLAELGHHVERAEPHYGVLGVGVLARSLEGIYQWSKRVPDPTLLDGRTRHNAAIGRLLGGPVLRAARGTERPMQWQVGSIFRRFDLVVTPTTAQPPLRVGALDGLGGWQTDKRVVAACPYTWAWNALGWPAVSVPAGLTEEGLPLGAQLLGAAHSEPRLLSVAAQLEAAERWSELRPPAPGRATGP